MSHRPCCGDQECRSELGFQKTPELGSRSLPGRDEQFVPLEDNVKDGKLNIQGKEEVEQE